MKVFAEPVDGGALIDISVTGEGRFVIGYVRIMRAYGLSPVEIEEDVGGGELAGEPFDGIVPWACEAVFHGEDIFLGDPRPTLRQMGRSR